MGEHIVDDMAQALLDKNPSSTMSASYREVAIRIHGQDFRDACMLIRRSLKHLPKHLRDQSIGWLRRKAPLGSILRETPASTVKE